MSHVTHFLSLTLLYWFVPRKGRCCIGVQASVFSLCSLQHYLRAAPISITMSVRGVNILQSGASRFYPRDTELQTAALKT